MKFKKFILPSVFLIVAWSCVPSELDNIESFEYTFPGLEEVEPLPEVTLTTPPEVVQTTGKIVIPPAAEALTKDIKSEENLKVIETFTNVAPEVSSQEIITAVTDEWISGVLSGVITPTENQLKISNEFKENPELSKYLTQLELPTVNGVAPGGRLLLEMKPEIKLFGNELLINLTLVGPCKDAAEKIYLENVKTLEDASVAQLAQSQAFYNNLRSLAEASYIKWLADGDQIISENLTSLSSFLGDLNSVINQSDASEDVKRGLKSYILAFAIQYAIQLSEWEIVYTQAGELAKNTNLESILIEQTSVDDDINANLADAIKKQTASYNAALNNCHNQGAGG